MENALSVQEIARQLALSPATVSRALSADKCALVREDTRKRILDFCKAHHYTPNFSAQALRKGTQRTIGVLMPHASGHHGELEILLDREIVRQGYTPIFSFWNINVSGEHAKTVQRLLARQIDGLITTHYSEIPENCHVPVVIYGNKRDEFECVYPDKYQFGRDVIRYLAGHGFTKIGAIGELNDVRYEGMKDELKARNIPFHPEWFITWSPVDSLAFSEKLELKRLPEVLVFHADTLAERFYHWAHSKSLRIPEDISVISFDNLKISGLMFPPLTTWDPHIDKAAKLLVKSMLGRIHNPALPLRQHAVPVTLVERQSLKMNLQSNQHRKGLNHE